MPKVVVYVRAEDARMIEVTEGREIGPWVRALVREQINHWHAQRVGELRPLKGEERDAVRES